MRENAGQNNSEYGHFLRSDVQSQVGNIPEWRLVCIVWMSSVSTLKHCIWRFSEHLDFNIQFCPFSGYCLVNCMLLGSNVFFFFNFSWKFWVKSGSVLEFPGKMLTHFMPLISFYIPWKHQKTRGFLMFSRGMERDQCHEMG